MQRKIKKLDNKKSFTLFEMIVSIVVIALIAGAVTTVFVNCLDSWQRAKQAMREGQNDMMGFDWLVNDIRNAKNGIAAATNTTISVYQQDCSSISYSLSGNSIIREVRSSAGILQDTSTVLDNASLLYFNYFDASNVEVTGGTIDVATVTLVAVRIVLANRELYTTVNVKPVSAPQLTGGPYSKLILSRYSILNEGSKQIMADNDVLAMGGAVCGGSGGGGEAPITLDFLPDRTFWGYRNSNLIKYDIHGNPTAKFPTGSVFQLSANPTDGSCWVMINSLNTWVLSRYDSSGNLLLDRIKIWEISGSPYAQNVTIRNIKAAPDGSCWGTTTTLNQSVPVLFQLSANGTTLKTTSAITNNISVTLGLAIDKDWGTRNGFPGRYAIWVVKPAPITGWVVYRYRNDTFPVVQNVPPPNSIIAGYEANYMIVDPVTGDVWTWGLGLHPGAVHKLDSVTGLRTGIGSFSVPYSPAALQDIYWTQPIAVERSTQKLLVANFSNGYNIYSKDGAYLGSESTPFRTDIIVTLQ